jgi:hypothetical protein
MVLQSWRMQGIICCKVNTSYTLEKVHEFIAEKGNPKSPSIPNHSIMNACILSDAQLIMWRNEHKVITHARTKATLEWDCL